MIVYRIAEKEYSNDISGYGASLYGGRWNFKSFSLLYCATSVSLASLEVLVRLQNLKIENKYELVVISIPTEAKTNIITSSNLSHDWIQNNNETQLLGLNWVNKNQNLIIEVPSAIVPIDKNILINPNHPLFKKVEIIDSVEFNFDNRLFKTHVF